MLKKIIKTLDQFKTAVNGSVATVTAVSVPVLLLSAGFALDYGLAMDADKEIQAAADAAALGALNEARIAYLNNEDVDLKELIEASTREIFANRTEKFKFVDISSVKIEPSIIDNMLSNKVAYSARYNTRLMNHAGVDYVELGGTARATVATTSYININFVFDVSASMGIGATPNDQKIMDQAIGCAFACHVGSTPGSNSSYDTARNAGASMRIDVARQSAINAISTIEANIDADEQVTFGLTAFSNDVIDILDSSDSRASDINYVKQRINQSVFMTREGGGTNIERALEEVFAKIPKSGTGATPESRLQYVIVLTDGVESTQALTSAGKWIQHPEADLNTPFRRHATHEVNYALNAAVCDGMRRRDIKTYFIYTEYVEPSFGDFHNHDQQRFGFIEDELFDIIPDRFSECAGGRNFVVNADTPQEIDSAFLEIVGEISNPLRLY